MSEKTLGHTAAAEEITPHYGSIPGKLLEQVRREMEKAIGADRLKITRRTE